MVVRRGQRPRPARGAAARRCSGLRRQQRREAAHVLLALHRSLPAATARPLNRQPPHKCLSRKLSQQRSHTPATREGSIGGAGLRGQRRRPETVQGLYHVCRRLGQGGRGARRRRQPPTRDGGGGGGGGLRIALGIYETVLLQATSKNFVRDAGQLPQYVRFSRFTLDFVSKFHLLNERDGVLQHSILIVFR